MKIPRVIALPFLLIPWLLCLAMGGWLLLQRFPLNGIAHFAFPFNGSSPWFDPFLPGERVTQPGPQPEGWIGQRIFNEPAYASARIPGAYDEAEIMLEAKTLRQPMLEFGYLVDPATFTFELQPMWSEELAKGWHQVKAGSRQGFVLDGLPDETLVNADVEHLLLWHATTTLPARMDGSAGEKSYAVSLRGALDIYAIPTDGKMDFQFSLQDVNRSRAGKTVAFRVTIGDETLWTDAIGTGGSQDRSPDQVLEKRVRLDHLAPGVYRLQVIADDDIFIRRIATPAAHWVVGPRVYFADAVGYATSTPPAIAWTNSRHLSLQTFHNEGLQRAELGSIGADLRKTHETYTLNRANGSGSVLFRAPKGDIRVVGDGYFAFTESALFYPSPRRFTDQTDLKAEGIQAVVTNYQPPELLADGWFRSRSRFPIEPQADRLKLALSAPGILLRQGAVDIRSAEMTYRRPAFTGWVAWWKYVRRELAAAWHCII